MTTFEDTERLIVERAMKIAATVPGGKAHILPDDWHDELDLPWDAFDTMACALRILHERGIR